MNLEQLTWSIADRMQRSSETINIVDEMALLFAWRYLSEQYPDLGLPHPRLVVEDRMSLLDVYKQLAGQLNERIPQFSASRLPHALGAKDIRYIVREVSELGPRDKNEYIDQLFSLSQKEKSRAHHTLPNELVELMVGLSVIRENAVYAPFVDSLQLAVNAAGWGNKVVFEGVHDNAFVSSVALLAELEVHNEDPLYFPSVLKEGRLQQFNNVITSPAFGRHVHGKVPDRFHRFSGNNTNGDVLALEHALSQCAARMVALVPQGLLFRGANDFEFRSRLLDSGWLEAVIQLPSPLLGFTNVATAIIVIDKKRKPESPILFFDADQPTYFRDGKRGKPKQLTGWEQIAQDVLNGEEGRHSVYIESDELRDNRYDLSVKRYVMGEATMGVRQLTDSKALSEIADLVRGQLLKEEDSPVGKQYLEAGVKDIADDGVLCTPTKMLRLSGRMKDRAELQRLQPGDILLVTKGSVGRVGIVGPDCAENWVASQSFQVIRLKSANYIAKPEILFRFLSSPLVQAYLLEQTTGTTIPVVKTGDIKELPVPQLELDKQHRIIQTHNKILETHQQMLELQQRIEKLKDKHWALRSNAS